MDIWALVVNAVNWIVSGSLMAATAAKLKKTSGLRAETELEIARREARAKEITEQEETKQKLLKLSAAKLNAGTAKTDTFPYTQVAIAVLVFGIAGGVLYNSIAQQEDGKK